MNRGIWQSVSGVAVAAGLVFPALAQRADENATSQAGDAFGFSVGNESVGLYNAGEVRGFNPSAAGNVRIEGLYFDESSNLPGSLIGSTTIRVGLSAQDFDLPAPSGIVDQTLRIAEKTVTTTTLGLGGFLAPYVDLEGGWVSQNKRWAVTYGMGTAWDKFESGGTSRNASAVLLVHGKLSEAVDVTIYGGRFWYFDDQDRISIYPSNTGGAFLPPQFSRRVAYSQPWGEGSGNGNNIGLILNASLDGNWDFKLGAFGSRYNPALNFEEFFEEIDRNGRGIDKMVIRNPDTDYKSLSGEARLSKTLHDGDRMHAISTSVRGRVNDQRFGGDFEYLIGPRQLGVLQIAPQPTPIFTEQTSDTVKQVSGALSYRLSWKGVGLLNLGIQKTYFEKTVDDPEASGSQTGTSSPLLFNASAAIEVASNLVLFGGYTRGLEEGGVAPSNAANRSTVLPVVRTTQRDIGLRWAITKNSSLVAAIFDLRRPFADIDRNNIFGFIGNRRNRGVEISLSSKPIKGLSVVLGALFLDSNLSGETVIAPKPLGDTGRTIQANISYDVQGIAGLSLNSNIQYFGNWNASRDNTLKIPDRVMSSFGGRYRFKALGGEHVARATIDNLTNNYGWRIFGNDGFSYNAPRRISFSLTSDW
jgi:iron complex outermembrane recepter protein